MSLGSVLSHQSMAAFHEENDMSIVKTPLPTVTVGVMATVNYEVPTLIHDIVHALMFDWKDNHVNKILAIKLIMRHSGLPIDLSKAKALVEEIAK